MQGLPSLTVDRQVDARQGCCPGYGYASVLPAGLFFSMYQERMTNTFIPSRTHLEVRLGALTHIDVGDMNWQSIGGAMYFVTFIHEVSDLVRAFPHEAKGQRSGTAEMSSLLGQTTVQMKRGLCRSTGKGKRGNRSILRRGVLWLPLPLHPRPRRMEGPSR